MELQNQLNTAQKEKSHSSSDWLTEEEIAALQKRRKETSAWFDAKYAELRKKQLST